MQSTTVKVNSCEEFRLDAAKAIIKESSHGWIGGTYFVDPSDWRIYLRQENSLWAPWSDDTFVIHLSELAPGAINVNDSVEDWEEALCSKEHILQDILIAYAKETDDEDEQPLTEEVISWAREHEEYSSIIEECEEEAVEQAISFVLEEFIEEIEIEIEIS